MNKYPEKAVKRFESKITKTDDCHLWNAARQKQGYGMFSYDGKSTPAHRFAYLLYNGDIAENMVVHQTCETNECVNPEHLVLQTKSQNKKSYSSVRVSQEMVERESVKYLYKLRNLRPDLQVEIDAILMKLISTETKDFNDDFGFELETKKKEYL
jgi:hypothetical protein